MVVDESFVNRLRSLESRVDPLARLVHAFEASLPKPVRYHSGKEHHGFRYAKPCIEHFCLLKAARVVSALNASLVLARNGYPQEVGVLIRTLIEFTTHIEFVSSGRDDAGQVHSEIAKYVDDFFADFARNSRDDFKRAQVKQGAVNKRLGDSLDEIAQREGGNRNRVAAERLYSNIYLTYSNYVQGKYPEIMDMYGGVPEHFHLYGMGGTPKDDENFQIVDTFLDTASIAFKLMVSQLRLHHLPETDPVLADWFRSS